MRDSLPHPTALPRRNESGPQKLRAAGNLSGRSAIHFERIDEGALRDFNLPELAHLLLAFLLLLQKLFFRVASPP